MEAMHAGRYFRNFRPRRSSHANSDFNVIVIGADLGGLSLAQSLRRNGIQVQIFARDHGPFDRPQGYRLPLDADAINACKEVLSPELNAVFVATAQWTEDLSVVKRLLTEDDHGDVWLAHKGGPIDANVDRATLRKILFEGLADCLQYGKTLNLYKSLQTGVTAYFSDGTTVRGNLLVGADGIRSAVRRQRAPHAETVDAGITAIYGLLPAGKAITFVPTETLEDIFTLASDERKVFLGLGSVRFPIPPGQAAEKLAIGLALRPLDDHVVCIVGGRHEFFPSDIRGASGETLQRTAAATIEDWSSERAAAVIRACDPSAFFRVEMYTSVICALDTPTNVSLLGDAIHAMTPTLGRGADIAMRDGALLGRGVDCSDLGAVFAVRLGISERFDSLDDPLFSGPTADDRHRFGDEVGKRHPTLISKPLGI